MKHGGGSGQLVRPCHAALLLIASGQDAYFVVPTSPCLPDFVDRKRKRHVRLVNIRLVRMAQSDAGLTSVYP